MLMKENRQQLTHTLLGAGSAESQPHVRSIMVLRTRWQPDGERSFTAGSWDAQMGHSICRCEESPSADIDLDVGALGRGGVAAWLRSCIWLHRPVTPPLSCWC